MKTLLILILSLTAQISFAQRGTGDIGSAEIPTGNSITEKFRTEIEGKKLILSEAWGESSCLNNFNLRIGNDATQFNLDGSFATIPLRTKENNFLIKDHCETETSGIFRGRSCTRVSQKILNKILTIEETLSEDGFYSIAEPRRYHQHISLSYNSYENTIQITEAHSSMIQRLCIYKISN